MINTSEQSEFSPFISGKRIYLREVRISDINESYYDWMNDPQVTRYLESRFYPNSKESLENYVKSKTNDLNNIFLAIILKSNHAHIGNIKLGSINWIHRTADLGIIIGKKEVWGQGYATEAIQIMSDYAFNTLNLRKLVAGCYNVNQASAKAFQKAGFIIEGVLRQHYFLNGEYIDCILMGLLQADKI